MRSIKIKSVFIFLFYAHCSAHAQLVPVSDSELVSQGNYVNQIQKFPNLIFSQFKNQSFKDKETGEYISAGSALRRDGSSKMECFLYYGINNKSGIILFTSARTESTWECTGNPAVSLKKLSFGRKRNTIVFALFEFRPPSGEYFKFPFAADVTPNNLIGFHDLQSCIEKRTAGINLQKLQQVISAARKCGFE
ncbi:hypothetical protein HH212_05055 [Massilia forsythiae]|uniref:Uncharacterized protein n=1 Tax=Massilia forsythiae TaxID=2728020 RepID=A0A7Z2VUI6_9BURK|nr:hypothetical protein [Massilia forsythiae]QJD99465.1 hypothetical protein HH212_05055 [Massilia forsythiae]